MTEEQPQKNVHGWLGEQDDTNLHGSGIARSRPEFTVAAREDASQQLIDFGRQVRLAKAKKLCEAWVT